MGKFVKGQSGNPGGKVAGMLSRDQVAGMLGKMARMSMRELEALRDNPNSTMLEVTIASIFVQAFINGDYNRLEFLLSRSIGKVKDEIEQTVKSLNTDDLDKVPREKIIDLVRTYKKV